jgi:MFS family permease
VFGVHGAVTGTFAARIPAISEHLHLSPGQLGLALLAPAAGALLAMSFTARVIHTLGGRRATQALLAAWCLALILPPLAPDLGTLAVALFGYGAAGGMADIAMNAVGSELEQRIGRSIMSGLHGLWSVGGFLAAGVAVLATRHDVSAPAHLALMGLVTLVVGQFAARSIQSEPAADAALRRPAIGRPSGVIVVIGLVAFCSVFAELAGTDWCAVYLRRVLGASNAVAASAYAVFAVSMAVVRLIGDQVVDRFGATRTVRAGAILATAGGVLIALAITAPLTIVGFGMIGVGIAVVVPLAFAAAGRVGGQSGGEAGAGNAIAGVATIAYGAGLAAPAAIGGLATLTSLPGSFAVVTALLAMVAGFAHTLGGRPAPREAT